MQGGKYLIMICNINNLQLREEVHSAVPEFPFPRQEQFT